jgi:hypothetical protein
MGFHMSQKPQKASEEEKKKRKRKKKSKQTITRAVAHIRLLEANVGKLSTLDALMSAYLELCQQYTTLFCQAESKPDKWSEPVYATELSERLHRVAMQQAAGIAQSFRTNRSAAYQAHLQDVAAYEEAKAQAEVEGRMATFKRREPTWTEWNLPVLRVPVMQANANVVVVEPSTDSTFDYWLRIVRRFGACEIALQEQEVESIHLLGHPTYLMGKPYRENSMLEKRLDVKVWSVTHRKSCTHGESCIA